MNELANNPIIEVHDMTAGYRQRPVLWNVDIALPKGQIIGLMGPNGAGKSSLLKVIMGLLPPSTGYVKLFDQPLALVRQKVAYVPQRESVDWDFPITVEQVVLMGTYGKLKLWQRPSSSDKAKAAACLDQVNMAAFAKRPIGQLSGGQQQRVFLARALAQDAELYLMDEPFAGVDITTEQAIVQLLHELKDQGKTIVVVHHDLHTASQYFDWMVLLNTRVVASGPTKDVLIPQILKDTYGGQLTLLSELGREAEGQSFIIGQG